MTVFAIKTYSRMTDFSIFEVLISNVVPYSVRNRKAVVASASALNTARATVASISLFA